MPAIVRYPPVVPQGEVREQIVTAMDWFPTILELVGEAPPRASRWTATARCRLSRAPGADTAYGVMHWQWQKRWMVRDGDWKLMFQGARNLAGGDPAEIYLSNLSDELPERKNYAAERPDLVKRLTAAHQAWVREVTPKNLPSGSSPP